MSDEDKDHPLEGARFLHPHEDVDEENWPRVPHEYTITSKFIRRKRELGGIVDGDIIEDAIRYGELVKASQGHYAFVNDLGGVTISIIVTEENGPLEAVSIWPYVYDEHDAKHTGLWSSKQIYDMNQYVGNHSDEWRKSHNK